MIDVSSLGKFEIQGPAEQLDKIASDCDAELKLGEAVRAGEAWWCRLTTTRALVIGDVGPVRERIAAAVAEAPGATLLDATSNFGAMTVENCSPPAGEVALIGSVIETSEFGSAPWSPPPLTVEVTA